MGTYGDGTAALIPSSQVEVLIAGGSGRGKSSAAGLLVEQLTRSGYSVLMIDPEGDHSGLGDIPDVLTVGGQGGLPQVKQLVALLRRWRGSVVVDLSGVDDDAYLPTLMRGVARSRAAIGSPQWLVLDEAHRILADPATWPALANGLGTCLISWRPGDLEPQALAAVDVALVFPDDEYGANATLGALIASIGGVALDEAVALLDRAGLGQAVLAGPVALRPAALVDLASRGTRHVRHARKYADAALPSRLRFTFRRPGGEPTGRTAANLHQFHDVIAHCDDPVLVHHLVSRDLSRWALGALQDPDLADAFATVEDHQRDHQRDHHAEPDDLVPIRRDLLRAIEDRYLQRWG